ncbi:MAG: 4'-phosphopantetheinyl transferase superfamily protein [Patescibacteria group bacterium]
MKLGIDIVKINKFKKIKKTDFYLWQKVFTKNEWKYSFKDKLYTCHLAGIFAAKEAAFKAMGWTNFSDLGKIEVSHVKGGLPMLNFKKLHVSISHSDDTAIAVVIGQ